MATPARFPKGVGNVLPSDAARNLPIPSLTRVHYDFDDFDFFSSVNIVSDQPGWATATSEATNCALALIDGDGGQLRLTAGTADNTRTLMRRSKETFTLESGKRAWFGIRMKNNTEVTEVDWLAGLSVEDISPIASTAANRLVFHKDDGDTNIDFALTSGGSTTREAAIATCDTSFHVYEIEFDGVSEFKCFVDGVHTATITTTSFPTTEMKPMIALQNGSAGTAATRGSLDIDWVYAAKERTVAND